MRVEKFKLEDDIHRLKIGQYITPKNIVSFMAGLVRVKAGDKILDPTCGTGSFLIEIARKNKDKELSFCGVDINKEIIELARKNAYEYKIKATLINADSTKPIPIIDNKQFNLIIANFPLGVKILDRKILDKYKVGKDRRSLTVDALLLERGAKLLAKDGVFCVLVAEGILFGQNYKNVREWLKERLRLLAVISLPPGALYPYSGVKMSTLIFKNEEGKQGDVYFAKISSIENLRELSSVSKEFRQFMKGKTEFSQGYLVRSKDLGDRWDENFYNYQSLVLDKVLQDKNYTEKKLYELLEGIYRGSRDDVKKIWKYLVQKGDILFATKGTIGRPVFITREQKIYESKTEYLILRPLENEIVPFFLYVFLKSDLGLLQIERLKRGVTIPYIDLGSIRNLRIVYPPDLKQQAKIAADNTEIDKYISQLESLMKTTRGTVSENIFEIREPFSKLRKIFKTPRRLLTDSFPYPVASMYRKIDSTTQPLRRFHYLLDFFEVLLKYTAIFGIAMALKEGKRAELNTTFRRVRFSIPTLGAWEKTLFETFNLLKKDSLVQQKIGKINENEVKQILSELISLRDDTRGHGATISDSQAAEYIKIYSALVETLLRSFSFLSEFKLRKIINSRKLPNRYELEVLDLVGDNPVFKSGVVSFKQDLFADTLYIFDERAEAINLSPFLVQEQCPVCKNEEVFFYDKIKDRDGNLGPFYLGYKNGHKPVFPKYLRGIEELI